MAAQKRLPCFDTTGCVTMLLNILALGLTLNTAHDLHAVTFAGVIGSVKANMQPMALFVNLLHAVLDCSR